MTKLAEEHFLVCVKYGIWGSKVSRFSPWRLGDALVFLVETNIAGLAEVTGAPYMDDLAIWSNDLFPYRIPIKFLQVMKPGNRPSVLGDIRQALKTSNKMANYGSYMAGLAVLPDHAAHLILDAIRSKSNDLPTMCKEVDALIRRVRSLMQGA